MDTGIIYRHIGGIIHLCNIIATSQINLDTCSKTIVALRGFGFLQPVSSLLQALDCDFGSCICHNFNACFIGFCNAISIVIDFDQLDFSTIGFSIIQLKLCISQQLVGAVGFN